MYSYLFIFALIACAFGSFPGSLCTGPSPAISLMFSYSDVMVLGHKFRFLVHFELILLKGKVVLSHTSAHVDPILLAAFLEETVLFPD